MYPTCSGERGPVGIALVRLVQARRVARDAQGGNDMGDKGGRKDKAKTKQQQDKKHKDEEQRKQAKATPRVP